MTVIEDVTKSEPDQKVQSEIEAENENEKEKDLVRVLESQIGSTPKSRFNKLISVEFLYIKVQRRRQS